MRLLFTLPFMALVDIHHIMMNRHIIMLSRPNLNLDSLLTEQLDPFLSQRKVIKFSSSTPILHIENNLLTIPLWNIFQARQSFPKFHLYSRSHYIKFENSKYNRVMDYADFCSFEDKLAHIVTQYVEDKKNNWLLLLEDDIFTDNDSIQSYANLRKDTTWITTSIQNGNPDYVSIWTGDNNNL